MRTLACLAVLALATPAHAESFVDIVGGVSIPIGDDDWVDTVETSPKLGLRIGAYPQEVGAFLSIDWTPVNTDAQSSMFPGGSTDISAHRFRLMAGAIFHHPVSNTLVFAGRGGIGADIHRASVEVEFLGSRTTYDETDVGLGLEVAGGLWLKLGSMEVGGELALPIGMHDDDNDQIDFIYTTYDLELLFGVRFISR